jgi:putative transferase (TIGR04331 family)
LNKKSSEFEIFLNLMIKKTLPKMYLENFTDLKLFYEKEFKFAPKYLITENIHWPEEMMILCGLMQEKKTKLLIFQHGGMYGMHSFHPGENSETLFADKFLTWGWKKNNKTIPFYALKFNSFADAHKESCKENILFCINLSNRFFDKSGDIPRNNLERLKVNTSTSQLVNSLDKNFKNKIYVRYLKKTENSGMVLNKKNFSKHINFDKGEKKLYTILTDYKLIIHDSFNTAGLETMRCNKPSLFLINKEIEQFDKSFKPILKELIKNKIVHFKKSSLINFLNNDLKNIEIWWGSKNVIKIKKKFNSLYVNKTININNNLIKILNNNKI